MDINEHINSKITQLEKSKKILFFSISGILMGLLLILFLYHNSYGFFALILFMSLITIVVTSIYLALEYFKIIKEINYNQFILLELTERN